MKKLIVVMDLGCFKVYRVTKDDLAKSERIELIEHFDPAAAHTRYSDQVTDQAGRFPGSGANGNAMAQGEDHNAMLEVRKRLLKQLTERLNTVLRNEPCDYWYLSASKEIHPRVMETLSQDVRARLRKNLPADLTKFEGQELLARFKAA
jgi:hypothetical protein